MDRSKSVSRPSFDLNIPIAGVRTARMNSDGHHGIMGLSKVSAFGNIVTKFLFVENQVVRWSNDHSG